MSKRRVQGNMWLGIELLAWLRLLARNRFAVSPRRLHIAAAITLAAGSNSVLRVLQSLIHGRGISRTAAPDDPIFIIGHWRTGTTMLHELMNLDPANRCPTTYESLSPNHFLLTEKIVRRWLRFMMPRKRPMDNVRLGFDRPQEDEAALCNLGVRSPFLSVAFPNRPLQYPDYVTLDSLNPRELARWQAMLRRFQQMILYKRSGRLVQKSPQHTFRLPVLTEMYPRARFIYIARDPAVVFPSTVHFWKTMFDSYGVQTPNNRGLESFVLDTFAEMHQRFEATRHLIPPERLCELRYEDLVADPVAGMQKIYDQLQLGDFESVRPAVAHYAQRSQSYKTNRYEISPEMRAQIADRWGPYIEQYGYEA
jgi:hypothetical protein